MFQTTVVKKIKTHLYIQLLFPKNRVFYEIAWKNLVVLDSHSDTIWYLHFTYWISKATNTHLECIILIAFLLQQRLCKCTSLLYYMCIACLVKIWQSAFGLMCLLYSIRPCQCVQRYKIITFLFCIQVTPIRIRFICASPCYFASQCSVPVLRTTGACTGST